MGADGRLEREVLSVADEIRDPCSVAAAEPLGLVEMGLLREVELVPTATGGAEVRLTLRLTAPGCLYWLYFERELQTRLTALDGVERVRIERDRSYDWDESEIAPAARERLRQGRRRRLELARAEAG
jgi:metal-sulfur cluster biosynthetic enzyme